jgi:tetratricopeptide (TPR) repeat protein
MSDSFDQSSQAYERGRLLLESGDFVGAIVELEASVTANPHFKSLELLGEAWLRTGQPARAIVPLAAATTLNAQVRAPSLLAEAFLALGELIKAYEIATVALQRDANNKKAKAVLMATEEAYRAWARQ